MSTEFRTADDKVVAVRFFAGKAVGAARVQTVAKEGKKNG